MTNALKDPAWCGWCGGEGCQQCDPLDYLYEYDCDDHGNFLDEFDCGMTADGVCMYAGSEDCDWECPTRFKVFTNSRRRNFADGLHRRLGNLWHLMKNIRKLRRKKCDCGNTSWTVYGDNWLCDDCIPF